MPVDEARLYGFVGSQIRALRRKRNITQSTLAERVGVVRTTIVNIETEKQKPPLHLIYSICAALDEEPFRVLPPLAEVSSTKPVDMEINGHTILVSPKAREFLSTLNEG